MVKKKGKLSTPEWILGGYDSPEAYAKAKGGETAKKKSGKTFKIRICPKCSSDEVKVVLTGEEGKGTRGWECRKCGWIGSVPKDKELTEDEFMKYLDERGEEVA
jgi:ribosomal protein L37AE/L43A